MASSPPAVQSTPLGEVDLPASARGSVPAMAALPRSAAALASALLAALAAQLAFHAAGPSLAPPPPWGGVATYLAVVASVLGTGAVAPCLRLPLLGGALLLPAAVLTGLGVMRVGASAPLPAGAVLLCLLGAGTLAGAGVGGRVERAGHLGVVAYVSALADLFSVFTPGAPSDEVLRSEVLLSVVALPWPRLGEGVYLPILGVGDVVMTALYLAAARHLELGRGRMLFALAAGYLGCLAVLLARGTALPVLPFLGVAVVLGVPGARALPREERRPALLGAVVLTVLFAALALR